MITYVGTQANFWMVANLLLATILYLVMKVISQVSKIPLPEDYAPCLSIALLSGGVYGVSLGLISYHFDRKLFSRVSSGKIILLKALGSLCLITFLLGASRFAIFNPSVFSSLIAGIPMDAASWDYLYWLLLVYYSFMTLVISFVNQVNKKYGPGVLVPLLLGKYRRPQEEERIFMFMDLKSSTTIVEKLGHLRYSSFIRDCFVDINGVLFPFRAQVYQYVGDEIVVTWPEREGLMDHNCILFCFACRKQFGAMAAFYQANYGFVPEIKAGVHAGKVTAVEIGEIKKDIAYHGDTLNTVARIQSVCNEYHRNFLVSEKLSNKLALHRSHRAEPLGMVLLRGKSEKVAS